MKYIIHRGITSNRFKENSYTAIKRALINENSLGVEFDIRLTKDDKIVLSHDNIINFNYIENMNYKDIIKDKYLTTLDKILTINTDKILLIDIKVNNNYKKFGNVILKEINDNKRNIYLASFNKKVIKYLRRKTKYKKGIITFNYKKNNNDFVVINYNTISNKKINSIKNKEIFIWTIHNDKDLEEVKNKFSNIDNFYTIIDKEE
ncbi:MAG: glycerophosphodiester phosphodiesterase family protein [Bacilli bacterium]